MPSQNCHWDADSHGSNRKTVAREACTIRYTVNTNVQISYILYICFIKNQIYSHGFTFSCLILHGSVFFMFCFAFNLGRMLILMPCLVIQIEACFPHAASCLPTNPAVGGHWRSPNYRKQSRIPFHVSLSNPRGSFPTTAILRASFIYRKHLLLYCRCFFFSFPNHPKRVYHRAGRGLFSTASAYRPKGIKSVWLDFYFELPLKGDRTQQIQALAWKKKKKTSPYYFTVLAQAPVSQVPAHNKFYCNVINSWKEELGIKVLTQAARAAALRSVASVLTSAHIQDKAPNTQLPK